MKKGYKITSKSESKSLILLRDLVIKRIKKKYPNFNTDLSQLHKFVDINEINKLRLDIFNYLNNKIPWTDIISDISHNDIAIEIGRDMLIQSKINLSIQMPNDQSSVLSAHSDCWSSDSPFQINLWIPLTNSFSTNSMFIWNYEKSLKLMKRISNGEVLDLSPNKLKIEKRDFLKIKFGEILIFNPALIHGNSVNKTKSTRISLNVRLKSLFSPEPTISNPDRKFGTYYKKFHISEETSFAMKLIESGIFNENY